MVQALVNGLLGLLGLKIAPLSLMIPSIIWLLVAACLLREEKKATPTAAHGQNFSVNKRGGTIFGLRSYLSDGGNWLIDVDFFSTGDYILYEVSPAPVLQDVLDVLQQDIDHGCLKKVKRVVVNNRIALRLLLEGVITPAHFAQLSTSRP